MQGACDGTGQVLLQLERLMDSMSEPKLYLQVPASAQNEAGMTDEQFLEYRLSERLIDGL